MNSSVINAIGKTLNIVCFFLMFIFISPLKLACYSVMNNKSTVCNNRLYFKKILRCHLDCIKNLFSLDNVTIFVSECLYLKHNNYLLLNVFYFLYCNYYTV